VGASYADVVIPTLLLIGLVFGRWWRVSVPIAAVGWVVLLLVGGYGSGLDFVAGAGALALANLVVGVLVYQAIALVARGLATLLHRGRTDVQSDPKG